MAIATQENESPAVPLGWWQRRQLRRQRRQARGASHVKFRPTREGANLAFIVLFIFVGAVLRDIGLLTLIAATMIGLLMLQWRFNVSTLQKLTAKRLIADRISADKPCVCQLQVRNPKRLLGAWLVLADDRIQQIAPNGSTAFSRGRTVIDEVKPQAMATSSYEVRFRDRGKYRFGPCTLSTRFPMSLGKAWKSVDAIDEIYVHPRLGELLPATQSLLQNSRDGQHQSSSNVGVHEADFFGLRPWATGDSRRWIHWRTTARLGELSVRQFDRLEQKQVCVLLDLFGTPPSQDEADIHVERAVSFVATLTKHAAGMSGLKMSVAIAGDTSYAVSGVQSSVLANALLDRLAVVSVSGKPDLASALKKMTTALLANPHLIVVSTRHENITALQQSFATVIGPKASSRLLVKWLNVPKGDLEAYFKWTSNPSDDSAAT